MKRILLTDGQQRKTLAAARALGRHGLEVLVSEETRFAPALFSKYCCQPLVSPSPLHQPAQFADWLYRTVRRYHVEMLIPMDDASMAAVMERRAQFEQVCCLPLPSAAAYRVAADKAAATQQARLAGLNCPQTINVKSLADLPSVCTQLKYPVLIKPRFSSGSRGIRMVEEPAKLTENYCTVHRQYPWPLIQEYIPQGPRYDVCMLYNRQGLCRTAFVQKEIRHFPLPMGPSTVQESIAAPELVEQAAALLTRLNWYGIAEVEFMQDPRDGQLKFMEINPRFWGSLFLAVQCGVNFPWLLYRLACEEDAETVSNYEIGVQAQWLMGDLLHFLTNPQRRAMNPPLLAKHGQNLFDDTFSMDDPLPLAGLILACLRYLPDPQMWRRMFRR